jgi:hypothetical protein
MSSHQPTELSAAELADLDRLEAITLDGLGAHEEASAALAQIRARRLYRGTHGSFEDYVRERFNVSSSQGGPYEILARLCELTLTTLDRDALAAVDIQLTVRKRPGAVGEPKQPRLGVNATDDELVPRLRWLVSDAAGTIGDLAHRLERRATEIDDQARAELRKDLVILEDELEAVRGLLMSPADWDAKLRRLLEDEVPPFEDHTDPEDL